MNEMARAGRTRSDARRNTDRVREAAVQMLSERGTETTIMDIARHAGVGKATVYRNFPTKAALLAFAAEYHGQWLVERLDETLSIDNGWDGFRQLVEDTMSRIRSEPILLEALRRADGPQPAIGVAINERLEHLIALLRRQGSMRTDATVDDLGLLIIGSSEYLAERSADPAECARAAELITSALHRPGDPRGEPRKPHSPIASDSLL